MQRHCSRLHLHGNVQCHSRQSQGRNRQENTLKEQGSVEDIAALTAFLASDDARYITGQVIACDGGMTM
ncbi:MAG: SDR family oxidoreductase [Akkermansia sp.]